MKGRFSRITGSSFVRGVAALSGAQMAATALPLLAAPVIGRLYTPAEYAPLAAYMAFSGILGPLASLSFDKAIVAERSETGARALVGITIAISLIVALLVLLVVVPATLLTRESADSVWLWFLALPLSVALTGIGFAGTEYAVRHGRFGLIGKRQISVAVVPLAMTIACGFAGFGANGPIIGYLVGQLAGVLLILRFFNGLTRRDLRPSRQRARALVRRHRDYVLFTTPSTVLSTFSMQIPVFALTAIGALPLLGAFVRARQLVFLPLNIVGQSIGQVFRSHALQRLKNTGTIGPLYDRTLLGLLAIGLPGAAIFWYVAPSFFTLYMGPDWTEAGHVARILAPLLVLRLLVNPLASVFYLVGYQRKAFRLTMVLTAGIATIVGSAVLLGGTGQTVVIAYAAAASLAYIATVLICRQLAWVSSNKTP